MNSVLDVLSLTSDSKTGKEEMVAGPSRTTISFALDGITLMRKPSCASIELNQGRAAMMGILALMVHDQLGVSLIPSAVCAYQF